MKTFNHRHRPTPADHAPLDPPESRALPIQPWMIGRCASSCRRPSPTLDHNERRVGQPGAWDTVFQLRLGDLFPAELFWHEEQPHRRLVEPKDGYLASRTLDGARVLPNPMTEVTPDRVLCYLKRLPLGARFSLPGQVTHYTKVENDFRQHRITLMRSNGERLHAPGTLIVLADLRQIED